MRLKMGAKRETAVKEGQRAEQRRERKQKMEMWQDG
jgi:hypothetical protein